MFVTVIRSSRKTISIHINPDATVTVRAPRRASNREIEKFLKEKEAWINKHIKIIEKLREQAKSDENLNLTDERIRELADEADKDIPFRVEKYAEIIGVTYGRITIRNQKTRWGSCSQKGNLNFNCLLMLAPEEIRDYVVIHELCHRKEMNHSAKFWEEVKKVCPKYKEYERWLKNEGRVIIEAMQR